MVIGKYNKSVILTYTGVVLSLLGIFIALDRKDLRFAVMLLIIAGVCDLFDGKVARAMKRTEEEQSFGVEIDSLADMIDFVAFPIVLVYSLAGYYNRWYHVLIYILYALCAITRLGYFNITVNGKQMEEPVKYYRGLPVTYTALIFPSVWFLSKVIPGSAVSPVVFTDIVYPAVMGLTALFFILDIKIAKPRGVAYIVFAALAAAMIGYIVWG